MRAVTRLKRIERSLSRAHKARLLAGVDEVGVGAWAGPVVACAVLVKPGFDIPGLDDSKRLTHKKRKELVAVIFEAAVAVSIAYSTVDEIDRLNILQADMLAMARAVGRLPHLPNVLIVDGRRAPRMPFYTYTIIKGDHKCASVAAASVVAKVWRDEYMDSLAEKHTAYGWERNKGYGTAEHLQALKDYGVSTEHRRSYKPIDALISNRLF